MVGLCLLVGACTLAGCPGPERGTCESNDDCFQDEVCHPDRRICVSPYAVADDAASDTTRKDVGADTAPDGHDTLDTDTSGTDGDDATSDSDDGPCEPESDVEFCRRHDVECGEFTGADNCGDQRTIDCGAFEGFGCPGLGTCDTEDDAYECTCPDVDFGNSDPDICLDLELECGEFDPAERCRGWEGEGYETVDCGTCQPNGDCGRDEPNICGCDCEVDGRCYLDGDEKLTNPCKVCVPANSTDSLTDAPSGDACGKNDRGTCAEQMGTSLCQCPTDRILCEGACVDFRTNDSHCGECGNVCFGEESCQDGTCQ